MREREVEGLDSRLRGKDKLLACPRKRGQGTDITRNTDGSRQWAVLLDDICIRTGAFTSGAGGGILVFYPAADDGVGDPGV